MNELDYLDQIETNTSYIDNIWSDLDYIRSQNESMITTLNNIKSQTEQQTTLLGCILLAVVLIIIYKFVRELLP